MPPSTAVPDISGRSCDTGGAACTTAETADARSALPAWLLAVTTLRTVAPTSAAVSA